MVAVLATQSGRNAASMLAGDQSFTFIEDGPEGPMDIPVPALRAESPLDALSIIAKHKQSDATAPTPVTASDGPTRRRRGKAGRNE